MKKAYMYKSRTILIKKHEERSLCNKYLLDMMQSHE